MSSGRAKLSDLVVGVVLLLLLGTFSLAQFGRAQETANRVKCASNLRQIGQAMLLYSNENRGSYPRLIWDKDKPAPTWGTPYEGNPNLKAESENKLKQLFYPDKCGCRAQAQRCDGRALPAACGRKTSPPTSSSARARG